MRREFTDQKQRAAVCHSTWRDAKKGEGLSKLMEASLRPVRMFLKIAKRRLRDESKVRTNFEIVKVLDESEFTYVLGPVLVPESVDKQGDIVSREEVEKAAHGYMEDSQRPGLMHRLMLGNRDAAVVESYLTRVEHKFGKRTIPEGTWMVGMRLYEERLRKLVLSGEMRGYSIGGQGVGIEE